MKKLFVVAIALIASINCFSQNEYGTSKEWNQFYISKPKMKEVNQSKSSISFNKYSADNSKFITTDVVFNIGEQSITLKVDDKIKVFQINSQHNLISGGMLYKCSDSFAKSELIEISLDFSNKTATITRGLVSLSGVKILESSYFKTTLTKENKEGITRSFGAVGGITSYMGQTSTTAGSYGLYIDFGRIGFEYNGGGSYKYPTDKDISNFISNQSKIFAGETNSSFGLFFKLAPTKKTSAYLGTGLQLTNEYSVTSQSIRVYNNSYSLPNAVITPKTHPYLTLGILSKLNKDFSFKGGLIYSQSVMLNAGFGFNF